MDKLNKSSWIVNTTKHLNVYKNNAHELRNFSDTLFSGRASILLSKLSASHDEIISGDKVEIFATDAYISSENISPYLKALKKQGMVDYKLDDFDRPTEVEVYCFSNETAIDVASNIFEERVKKEIENANLDLLEGTYIIPMNEVEIKDKLSNKLNYKEENVERLIELHQVLNITKENRGLRYNEYTFTGNEDKIMASLSNLKTPDKDQVKQVLDEISRNQGLLYDNLKGSYDSNILKMMEGVGMIEGIDVISDFGNATFVTTPQIKGTGVGKFDISSDIFHKAKVLLSCLRFGQEKSTFGRGRISTEEKMINIIRKLNRGEWLNPCTAAGEDYKLLEREGVVSVKQAMNGMYQMKLRQPEVGILVEQMINYNRVISSDPCNIDSTLKVVNATEYRSPEIRRNNILAADNQTIKSMQDDILQAMRS